MELRIHFVTKGGILVKVKKFCSPLQNKVSMNHGIVIALNQFLLVVFLLLVGDLLDFSGSFFFVVLVAFTDSVSAVFELPFLDTIIWFWVQTFTKY